MTLYEWVLVGWCSSTITKIHGLPTPLDVARMVRETLTFTKAFAILSTILASLDIQIICKTTGAPFTNMDLI